MGSPLKLIADHGAFVSDAACGYAQRYEHDVFARTLYGECLRFHGFATPDNGKTLMRAVASVIMNRLHHAQRRRDPVIWWGRDLVGICQYHKSFQSWNRTQSLYKRLVTAHKDAMRFASARAIASGFMKGTLNDITHGALFYHSTSDSPIWARGKQYCYRNCGILFYI